MKLTENQLALLRELDALLKKYKCKIALSSCEGAGILYFEYEDGDRLECSKFGIENWPDDLEVL